MLNKHTERKKENLIYYVLHISHKTVQMMPTQPTDDCSSEKKREKRSETKIWNVKQISNESINSSV